MDNIFIKLFFMENFSEMHFASQGLMPILLFQSLLLVPLIRTSSLTWTISIVYFVSDFMHFHYDVSRSRIIFIFSM